MDIPKETLLDMYRKMLLARKVDDKYYELNTTGAFTGWLHLGAGHEAIGIGVGSLLRKDDYIKITVRTAAAVFIAKGISVKTTFAGQLGRIEPSPVNRVDYGFLGGSITLGEEVPIYIGAAWSAKLDKSDRICVCFFGDGTANRAPMHESMNLAAIFKLPVIFLCENNGYGLSMPTSKSVAINDIAERGAAYGMPGVVVDGNDVIAVYEVAHDAIEKTRAGNGPILIEAKTYRLRGHFEGDPEQYRTREEVEEHWKKEPVGRYRDTLIKKGVLTEKEAERYDKETTAEIEEALKYALSLPKFERKFQ